MRHGVALALTLIVLGGCKKGPSEADPPKANGAVGTALTAVDHEAMFAHVPDGALLVATFDMGTFWTGALDHNFGLVPVVADPAGVRAAVTRASRLTVGADITSVETVVFWASFGPAFKPSLVTLLIGPVGAELAGEDKGKHEGVTLVKLKAGPYAAKVDAGVLLGDEEGVKKGIEVAVGKSKSLANGAADEHKKALKSVGSGTFTATVALGPMAALAPAPFSGLEGAAISLGVDGTISAAVTGQSATLDGLVDQYESGLKMARAELESAVEEMREEKNPGLIMLVYVEQKWGDITAASKPKREGDALVSRVNVGSGATLGIAAIGIGATVGIPAFIKYARRAKTTEAIDQLDKMYKASAMYYMSPRVDHATGARVPCQFPPTTKLTPAPVDGKHPCCGPKDADQDDRCDADPSQWGSETWSALNFQMNDQHYFMYEFESNGKTGAAAAFTAKAYADLDCDGVFSTFERYGYADEDSKALGECSMKGSSAFYKDKETE